MSIFKKIGIIVGTIVFALCLVVDIWFLKLKYFTPKKTVSKVVEFDGVTIKDFDGTLITVPFVSVKLFKGPAPALEIKFNYLLDENKEHIFSQGLQYISHVVNPELFTSAYTDLELYSKDSSFWSGKLYENYRRYIYVKPNYMRCDRYNYMSDDDYETTLISTNPINDSSMFKISVDTGNGLAIYGLEMKDDIDHTTGKPKYSQEAYSHTNSYTEGFWDTYTISYDFYNKYTIDYLSSCIYDAVSSLPSGYNGDKLLEFGDVFDISEYDEDSKCYNVITDTTKLSLVSQRINTYLVAHVEVVDESLSSSTDSMFGVYKGSPNFNVDGETSDYYIGRSNVIVTEEDFEIVTIGDTGYYSLILSDKFLNMYEPYAGVIDLYVDVDLDNIDTDKIFYRFLPESIPNNFKVKQLYTKQIVNGNLVEVYYE